MDFTIVVFYRQVVCPTDYRLWQQSMYALFGAKWTKLHGGANVVHRLNRPRGYYYKEQRLYTY